MLFTFSVQTVHRKHSFSGKKTIKQFIIFIKKKSILCSWTNIPYQFLFAKYRKMLFSTAGVLFYFKNCWLSSHNNIFQQDIHNLSSFLLNTKHTIFAEPHNFWVFYSDFCAAYIMDAVTRDST